MEAEKRPKKERKGNVAENKVRKLGKRPDGQF